jgi:serine/threonine protein kinase
MSLFGATEPFISAQAELSLKAAGYLQVPTIAKQVVLNHIEQCGSDEIEGKENPHPGKVFHIPGLENFSVVPMNGEYFLMPHVARSQLKWGKMGYVKPAFNVRTGEKIALKVNLFDSSSYVSVLSKKDKEIFNESIRETQHLKKFGLFMGETIRKSKTKYTSNKIMSTSGETVKLKKYTAMPFAEGEPLKDYYTAGKIEADFSTLVTQAILVCKAIKFIHNKNRVHLDIKGDNIHWDSVSRRIKVLDFSCMRHINESLDGIVGSNGFTAPEILTRFSSSTGELPKSLQPQLSVDPNMDIYSLGILLKMLLSNSKQGLDSFELLQKCPELIKPCESLTSLLNQMTDVSPNKRPSLASIIEALEVIRTPEILYKEVLLLSKQTRYFWRREETIQRLKELTKEIDTMFSGKISTFERIILFKSLNNIYKIAFHYGDAADVQSDVRSLITKHMNGPLERLKFYIIRNIEKKISKLRYGGIVKDLKIRALQEIIRKVEAGDSIKSVRDHLEEACKIDTPNGAALDAKRFIFTLWRHKTVSNNASDKSDCVSMLQDLMGKCHAFVESENDKLYMPKKYRSSSF